MVPVSSDEATQYVDTGNGPPVTDSSPGGVVADLAVGTTIGRYVLLRELGRLRARRAHLDRGEADQYSDRDTDEHLRRRW